MVSYKIAESIVMQKKPYIIAEDLIMSAVKIIVDSFFKNNIEKMKF